MTLPQHPESETSAEEPSFNDFLSDLRAHLLWQETEGGRLVMVDHATRKSRQSVSPPAAQARPPAAPAAQPTPPPQAPAASLATRYPSANPAAPAATRAMAAAPAPIPKAADPLPGRGRSIPAPAAPVPATVRPGLTGTAAEVAALGEEPTLDEIRRLIGDCRRCGLCQGRKTIVYGAGNPRARLVFVGEGPGADEDQQGQPFVGQAGQLLTKMIEAMGFSRDEVYICNVVKCRPPNNRNPEPEEVSACEPFLQAQLKAIRPEVIVALGKFAAQTLLRDQTPITRMRGTWREYQGIPLMPTFHPAYLLRTPGEKKTVWADLQQVMARFGKKK